MRDAMSAMRWKKLLVAVLCFGGALWGVQSQARDRDDDRRRHSHFERRHDDHGRHHRHRRDDDRRPVFNRDWRHRDWHFHRGRYWAPARYRGRYCNDRGHFRGVHYHVAIRDYYDYYYPRYRYYGPRPYAANASVIISVPLF